MVHNEATNLIQLAMGLVTDLGLNRWPSDFGKASFAMFRDASVQPGKGPWRKKHSLGEMRAVLGMFYVTSLYVCPPPHPLFFLDIVESY